MIYCVWYPSGGFGHFINAVLTLHGENFVRPTRKVKFSNSGNLHHLDLILPKYFHNHNYNYNLETVELDKNYSVLIDNGINDESTKFTEKFKHSKIIKICYTDDSWPIVAKTSIIKAANTQLEHELTLGKDWDSTDDWAIREKYFLYLKDHPNRHAWKPSPGTLTLLVDYLCNYDSVTNFLKLSDIQFTNFSQMHSEMLQNNRCYFDSVQESKQIINAVRTNNHIDVTHITDLWDQAVVNYFLYIKFGIEVPANTYANWFTNTEEISKLLKFYENNYTKHSISQ